MNKIKQIRTKGLVAMDKMKVAYLTNAIDGLVESTGYPVTGSVIIQSGLSTRKELRKLEKKGILKACYVIAEKGALVAYYTEGVIPDAIRRKQAELNKPDGDASEGGEAPVELQGRRTPETSGREVRGEGSSEEASQEKTSGEEKADGSQEAKNYKEGYAEHEYEQEGYSQKDDN
jgi:hypothetical protein